MAKSQKQLNHLLKLNRNKIGTFHSKEAKKKMSDRAKLRKGNLNSFYNKHHTETNKKRISSTLKKLKIKPKIHFSSLGKDNPNWKGGITSKNHKIRNSIEIKLWKKAIFERDNFVCQKCGKLGGELIAHHIFSFNFYPEFRTAIDKGITLCKKCHQEFHKKYGVKNNTDEQLRNFLR